MREETVTDIDAIQVYKVTIVGVCSIPFTLQQQPLGSRCACLPHVLLFPSTFTLTPLSLLYYLLITLLSPSPSSISYLPSFLTMTDITDDVAEEISFQSFDDDCRLLGNLLNDILQREVGTNLVDKLERIRVLAQVKPTFHPFPFSFSHGDLFLLLPITCFCFVFNCYVLSVLQSLPDRN